MYYYVATNGTEYQACDTRHEGLYAICEVLEDGGLLDLGNRWLQFVEDEDHLAEIVEELLYIESENR